jgi:acetate kinase
VAQTASIFKGSHESKRVPAAMIILTVNSGSTSVKWATYEVAATGQPRQVGAGQSSADEAGSHAALGAFLETLPHKPDAVAHRVVHGGTRFTHPVLIDASVMAQIGELSELAPLHNPKALRWVKAAQDSCGPDVPQVAAFDTSFFAGLPRVAGEYALSAAVGIAHGVRRYGFHGLAHEAMSDRWQQLQPGLQAGGRLITLQLGGGCSVAALLAGRPLDTSMGFSPLEGLVMATRSGDIDAAVVPYLQRRLGRTSDEIIGQLNGESGLAGISGTSTDLGTLLASAAPQCQFAVDLYCYRARKYIGAYMTVLGGCDGIVFGGGVGEHVPGVRARILSGMQWAGIELDAEANELARGKELRISAPSSRIAVHVISVDEEQRLVAAALAILRTA